MISLCEGIWVGIQVPKILLRTLLLEEKNWARMLVMPCLALWLMVNCPLVHPLESGLRPPPKLVIRVNDIWGDDEDDGGGGDNEVDGNSDDGVDVPPLQESEYRPTHELVISVNDPADTSKALSSNLSTSTLLSLDFSLVNVKKETWVAYLSRPRRWNWIHSKNWWKARFKATQFLLLGETMN